jgi:hypothetical protein
VIALHILIQAGAGPAAIVTAALGEVPGAAETASVAGPAMSSRRRDAGYRRAGQAGGDPRQGLRRRDADRRPPPGRTPVRYRWPCITPPRSGSWARAPFRRSARAAGAVRCSVPARQPARWTRCNMRPKLPICTSGRRLCNERRRMPGRDAAETPGGHVPASRQRHRGAHRCPAPAPPLCRHRPPLAWTALPDHHRRRQRDGAGCRARQPLPRGQGRIAAGRAAGRARACRSRALSLGGTGPGPVTQTAAGEDSLAGAAAPESIRQRHSQDGCTGRQLARLSHRPAVVLEEPCAMRLGRLVPAAAYRMRRSGSEWSRSRKSLPAHGHES